MLVGNDISFAQGAIVWSTYKDNTTFIIAKATEGVGYIDAQYGNNRKQAREYGVPFGSYHFARPDLGNSPQAEAEWFCKVIDGDPIREGELLFLDFEVNYSGNIVEWCKQWLDEVSNHFNTKPLIYLNQSLTKGLDWVPVINAGYGLWLASYNPDGQGDTGQWPFMAFQQTSSNQTVPGISTAVDRDVFFGDLEALLKYGYKALAPVMPPLVNPTPPAETTSEVVQNNPEPQPEQPAQTGDTPPVPADNAPTILKLNWLEKLIHKIFSWLMNK